MMLGIKFKDEGIIYFRDGPCPAIYPKENEEEDDEADSAPDLEEVYCLWNGATVDGFIGVDEAFEEEGDCEAEEEANVEYRRDVFVSFILRT
jgi:hypothetical protein